LPLVEAVRRAKAAGFDAVEFHAPYAAPAETVRATLRETGLTATGLNTTMGDMAAGELGLAALPGREGDARAAIDAALAYAEAIDAGYVHVTAGRPAAAEHGRARRAYLDALDRAAAQAASAGRIVVIEPLNRRDAPGYFLNSSAQATEIVRELGRANLKILFDCYHVQIEEGDLTRRLEKLLPLVGHIQIAAVPSRREPDEGEIAYDRLLKAVEAMGYMGCIGAEYNPREGVESGLGWLAALR
jgi:2-dehydrotetronate isomerase